MYFILLLVALGCAAKQIPAASGSQPSPGEERNKWADSVMATLTLEERIGQLFMVAAYSNKGKEHTVEIEKLITDNKIGGLIFMQGGPVRQAQLTNRFQSASKIPLLISIDGEWGLAMRLDSTVKFPRQMTLGAIQNDSLIYKMGAEIARQCKRIGIHVNFAPVADVNNNPKNPVISNRSFGEDKYDVARKSIAYMKGLQDNGVMANGKHFPGHGDTDSDSHKTLPLINRSRERIDSLELYPFKELFKAGLGSVMVAHLYIPSLDTTTNRASTLSKNIVTDLLKDSLGFKGLIFTDALNMSGVTKYFSPGKLEVNALMAGNDVLLFPENVPVAINEIKMAIDSGLITQAQIDEKCYRILVAKQWVGLDNYKPVELKNLHKDLNTLNAEVLNRKLTESSLTLLVNKDSLLPLKELDTLNIALLNIGHKEKYIFSEMLGNYSKVDNYDLHRDAKQSEVDTIIQKLFTYNLIIININNTNNTPGKNFGLAPWTIDMIRTLKQTRKVIVNIPANPYILHKIEGVEIADAVIMSYEDNDYSASYAAQGIFGGVEFKGRLPISTPVFSLHSGLDTRKIRFKYTLPEDVGVSSYDLMKIDTIVRAGIYDQAYPGCQVIVAKSGNIIYNKSFGYHTYQNKTRVKNSDVYDVASLTKITASLPSIMKLVDEEKINLDATLGTYLSYVNSTNKDSLVLRKILAHQAGLKDWIPFYLSTIHEGQYKAGIYNSIETEKYSLRVAEGMYMNKEYANTMGDQILKSPVNPNPKYVYSDLGYYFFKDIIEAQTGTGLEKYVDVNFYSPLGMTSTGYKPLVRFNKNQIPPTELDVVFRRQLVQGDVHDQGAAMLGGVGGHAGVFSNANDLAKMMQMYLQKGEYGGKRYISEKTMEEFIRCQYCEIGNRRGAGFDKPEPDPLKDSPACKCVSASSFGHSGFTGTFAWADPENETVYIFLSNRVYPDAENKKLARSGIRTRIQQVIYDAINAGRLADN